MLVKGVAWHDQNTGHGVIQHALCLTFCVWHLLSFCSNGLWRQLAAEVLPLGSSLCQDLAGSLWARSAQHWALSGCSFVQPLQWVWLSRSIVSWCHELQMNACSGFTIAGIELNAIIELVQLSVVCSMTVSSSDKSSCRSGIIAAACNAWGVPCQLRPVLVCDALAFVWKTQLALCKQSAERFNDYPAEMLMKMMTMMILILMIRTIQDCNWNLS